MVHSSVPLAAQIGIDTLKKAGIQIRIQGVDEGDMLIVKSGFALITVVLDDGTETISHIGGVGCAFGYISAISRKPYQTSICAYTDCSCYVISGRDVRLYITLYCKRKIFLFFPFIVNFLHSVQFVPPSNNISTTERFST